MPRYSSASLYEDALKVSSRRLRELGYFREDYHFKSGTLTWSQFDEPYASINIAAYMYTEPCITLSYNYGGEPRRYNISLVSLPSNLGKGKVWYFLCPHTGKRCRVLYFIEGYFMHREASSSRIYKSQTRSQFSRAFDKIFDPAYGKQRIHDELNQPYFKTHYAGRPTKRYVWLLQRAGYINQHLLEKALNELQDCSQPSNSSSTLTPNALPIR